ncbi:glycosyltransferase family 39 protein [Candidatus Woesearchaeota archaeon]|nr:glycosyltransferase family 39 protein [Candidatus Woesearchaeota archaeon]
MFSKQFWLLLFVILLAFALRLYQLDKESLWMDEAFSVHHAQEKDLFSLLTFVSTTEAAPPGHYLLLHYWIVLFGSSEFSLRFPSVLFGVFSLVFLFKIVKTFFSTKIALLSIFFMSISMIEILYSQEARLYGLFTFLSLLSAFFFMKIFFAERQKEKTARHYLSYFLSMALAIYTNYLALFLIGIYTTILLWHWPETKIFFKRWAAVQVFILVAALPLVPLALNQLSTIGPGASGSLETRGVPPFISQLGLAVFGIPFLTLGFLSVVVLLFKKRLRGYFHSLHLPPLFLFLVITAFSLLYAYLSFRPFMPLGLPLIRVPLTNSYFLTRHLLFLSPLIYVSFAYFIIKASSRKIAVLSVIILLIASFFSLGAYYSTPTKAQWKEAVAYIQEQTDGHPTILLDRGGFSHLFLLRYYSQSPIDVIRLTWFEKWRDFHQLSAPELTEKIAGLDKFWLVLSRNPDTNDYFKQLLDNQAKLIDEKEFYQIKVYKYERG